MWKIINTEFNHLSQESKSLDNKVVIVFLSSIFLFTLSWYFSSPKFFRESFTFIEQDNLILEELSSFLYWFLLDFMLFFIIPVYIIKLIFKEELKDFGISFSNLKVGILYALIALTFFIPVILLVSNSEKFSQYFPLMNSAKEEVIVFLVYESFFILFIFSWEFVFRGFLLFGLEKRFGVYTIFIQMMPFVLLHSGKPFIETFAAIFGGLFLGYLALRTRSMIYGFLIHGIILVLLDLIAIMNKN